MKIKLPKDHDVDVFMSSHGYIRFIYDKPASGSCHGNFTIKKEYGVWKSKPLFDWKRDVAKDDFLVKFVAQVEAYIEQFGLNKFDNATVDINTGGRLVVNVKSSDTLPEWRSYQAFIENDQWVFYLANGARVVMHEHNAVAKALNKLKKKLSNIKVAHDD